MTRRYVRRLIEADLPIGRISVHARREKDMRRGHIPLVHIYPAARPPAACRAVICAALWPDPADSTCPPKFKEIAERELRQFAIRVIQDKRLSDIGAQESWKRYRDLLKSNDVLDGRTLQQLLLGFIGDYASWDAATEGTYIEAARRITTAAHMATASDGSERPFVVDSFAGGGAIPLEAARLDADVLASDTSPVAVLLNKLILEFIPAHGEALIAEVKLEIDRIRVQAEKTLKRFYPIDDGGAIPTTYLWARTIVCEGPGCGATVPLIRSLKLVKKKNRALYLKMVPKKKEKVVAFEITKEGGREAQDGTVRRGAATCPICGYTTPVEGVRRQLVERRGGGDDAQLLAVVTTSSSDQGRSYRLPTNRDMKATRAAREELQRVKGYHDGTPNERISLNEIRRISVPLYGITHWGDLFTSRQALALSTYCNLVVEAGNRIREKRSDEFAKAVQVCLALLIDKLADMNTSLCVWQNHAEIPAHLFGRWAIGMVFDFAETNPLAGSSGSPEASGRRFSDGLEVILAARPRRGNAQVADATSHPLPNDSAHAFVVDPPYYDAIPYAHLMDFFYVWLKRSLGSQLPDLFGSELIPKGPEIVVDRPHQLSTSEKDVAFYERQLTKAFADGRRILHPDGIGIVVFASKTTASWEAILKAIVDAGWVITGSWPIDTEMESRVAAQGQARLASSVHLVCRPRESLDTGRPEVKVGDWRDVLQELPGRIHEWMPRLAAEGIVGADAIFACLGPALEVFSRYSKVEKATGEEVTLKEYLEHVWAAVEKEALDMIFEGADATGFEEDARLTAMWLWTLNAGKEEQAAESNDAEAEEDETSTPGKGSGFVLEFDAARKMAQGLGVHLDNLDTLVEVKADKARLLPITERSKYLFGRDNTEEPKKVGKKQDQPDLFDLIGGDEGASTGRSIKLIYSVGKTALDRVHQSMLLFGANRSEALKRLLVEEGVGRDAKFWRLSQALAALYPSNSEEKRWVEGVLGRKRGLGF